MRLAWLFSRISAIACDTFATALLVFGGFLWLTGTINTALFIYANSGPGMIGPSAAQAVAGIAVVWAALPLRRWSKQQMAAPTQTAPWPSVRASSDARWRNLARPTGSSSRRSLSRW